MKISRLKKKYVAKNAKPKMNFRENLIEIIEKRLYDDDETFSFHLDLKKSNKWSYRFVNKNYRRDFKSSYKNSSKKVMLIVPILILVVILGYLEVAMFIVVVLMIGLFIMIAGLTLPFLDIPKKLILRKYRIYEMDITEGKRNNFYFRKMEFISSPKAEIVFFDDDDSLVFFCSGSDKEEFKSFFQKYNEQCAKSKRNRLTAVEIT